LRADVSVESAEAFRASSIGSLVDTWRDPRKRDQRLWTNFEDVSQEKQEIIAAGFELIGRRPKGLAGGWDYLAGR
jgi:hypothetical protein